ncbi:MAG: hypothetical protein DRN15_10680 [Thermoprotei archaeon]|nr:MAG: hypothetical protein DRM97_07840 [Thermoprotei archaeon]RLF21722.1 MAG: hypothetical protein DRN15_10680 [Thermoprotei archaeon]
MPMRAKASQADGQESKAADRESMMKRNFLIVLARRTSGSLFDGLVWQYTDVYVNLIGLSVGLLGYVRSVSTVVSGTMASILGYMADALGRRKVMVTILLIQALGALLLALAQEYTLAVVGLIVMSSTFLSLWSLESILLADVTRMSSRGFSFSIANMLSQLSAIVAPLIAAYIIRIHGGISVGSIRPLFLIEFGGIILIGVPLMLMFKDVVMPSHASLRSMLRESFASISKKPWLRKWIMVEMLGGYVWDMTSPFIWIYAIAAKGADEMIVGLMGFGFNVANVIGSPLAGKLTDRIGRVKTILLFRPLFYLSLILLIIAPSPELLIIAWTIRGLWFSSSAAFMALTMELVPEEDRGKWLGIRSLFSTLARSPAPAIGGILYSIRPELPFIVSLVVDATLRLPLIASMPETKVQ